MSTLAPLPARERRNLLCFCLGESLWGFQSALVASGTVLTVLLLQLGADRRLLGVIPALEAGLLIAPQLLGMWLFRAAHERQARIIRWHYYGILPFILGVGLLVLARDLLPHPWLCGLILLCYAGSLAGMGTVGGAWLEWLAGIFDQRIRGLATGLSWGASALAGTGGALAAGWALTHLPERVVFTALYGFAAGLGLLSILTFKLVQDPAVAAGPVQPFAPRALAARFGQSLRQANFRNYLVGRLIAAAGFCVGPFVTVHFLSPAGGNMAAGAVVACSAAQTAASSLACVLLGRLGDWRGHRLGVLAGIAAQIVALAGLLLGRGPWACAGVFLALGLGNAAAIISNSNMMLETCPHDHRLAHITVGNLICSPLLVLFPLLAGAAAAAWSLPAVFAASLGLSLLALLWVGAMVQEPRALPTAKPCETSLAPRAPGDR